MILSFQLIVAIGQILLYKLLDHYTHGYGKSWILLLLILAYIFIIPPYFYPERPTDKAACGLPLLGITMAFWIFGNSITLIVHFLYPLFHKKVD